MNIVAETICVYIVIFLISSLLSLCIAAYCRCKYLSDAGLMLLIGFISGGLLHILVERDKKDRVGEKEVQERLIGFSSDTLFCYLLPPIIFKSGYDMQGTFFWANIDKILLLAFLGTLVSSLIVGVCLYIMRSVVGVEELSMPEALSFGALISATDPVTTLAIFEQLNVDPHLFNVVFGESVLNDAVSIVLFRTFLKFRSIQGDISLRHVGIASGECAGIFCGSAILGVLFAFGAALLFKVAQRHTYLISHGKELELALFLITCYTPFLLAEAFALSGIVSILFTGVVVRRYAHANLSDSTRDHSESIVGILAYAAESLIFIQLGTCAWRPFHASWQLVLCVTVVCLIARAAHVYPIGVVLNACPCKLDSGELRFQRSHMHLVWFSGLRGAIAYALSMKFPDPYREKIESLTMAIVLSSIWIMGGATEPLLRCQGITVSEKKAEELEVECEQVVDSRRLTVIEKKYLQPIFLRPSAAAGKRLSLTRRSSTGSPDNAHGTDLQPDFHPSGCRSLEMTSMRSSDASEPLSGAQNDMGIIL